MTPDATNRLLLWMKANAEEVVRDLREAGWEGDERGIWSRGARKGLHLFDAHEVMRHELATPDES